MAASVQINESLSPVTVTISESAVQIGGPTSTAHNQLALRTAADAHPASAITNTPAGSISATTVQAAINELDAEKQPLDADLTGLASDYAASTKTLTFSVAKAATSAGLSIQSNNGTLVVDFGPGGGAGAAFADGITCSSITATGASGIVDRQAATQDGIQLLGRAGGTSSYVGTLTPTTLTASRTWTFPNATGTVPLLESANTFTGVVTVPNGTAAAPGLRVTSEASGLYRIGATSIGVSVAGSLVLTVGSTASSFASGTTLAVSNTTAATSTTTGALVVSGGIGVAGAGFFGGNLSSAGTLFSIGASDAVQYGIQRNSTTASVSLRGGTAGAAVTTYGGSHASLASVCLIDADTIRLRTTAASEYARFHSASSALSLGATALVGSERLRVAGGSAATAGATDVTVGAGIIDMGVSLRYRGTQVVGSQGAAVADASGGTTVDAEARTAINTLLDRLRTHGLIAT